MEASGQDSKKINITACEEDISFVVVEEHIEIIIIHSEDIQDQNERDLDCDFENDDELLVTCGTLIIRTHSPEPGKMRKVETEKDTPEKIPLLWVKSHEKSNILQADELSTMKETEIHVEADEFRETGPALNQEFGTKKFVTEKTAQFDTDEIKSDLCYESNNKIEMTELAKDDVTRLQLESQMQNVFPDFSVSVLKFQDAIESFTQAVFYDAFDAVLKNETKPIQCVVESENTTFTNADDPVLEKLCQLKETNSIETEQTIFETEIVEEPIQAQKANTIGSNLNDKNENITTHYLETNGNNRITNLNSTAEQAELKNDLGQIDSLPTSRTAVEEDNSSTDKSICAAKDEINLDNTCKSNDLSETVTNESANYSERNSFIEEIESIKTISDINSVLYKQAQDLNVTGNNLQCMGKNEKSSIPELLQNESEMDKTIIDKELVLKEKCFELTGVQKLEEEISAVEIIEDPIVVSKAYTVGSGQAHDLHLMTDTLPQESISELEECLARAISNLKEGGLCESGESQNNSKCDTVSVDVKTVDIEEPIIKESRTETNSLSNMSDIIIDKIEMEGQLTEANIQANDFGDLIRDNVKIPKSKEIKINLIPDIHISSEELTDDQENNFWTNIPIITSIKKANIPNIYIQELSDTEPNEEESSDNPVIQEFDETKQTFKKHSVPLQVRVEFEEMPTESGIVTSELEKKKENNFSSLHIGFSRNIENNSTEEANILVPVKICEEKGEIIEVSNDLNSANCTMEEMLEYNTSIKDVCHSNLEQNSSNILGISAPHPLESQAQDSVNLSKTEMDEAESQMTDFEIIKTISGLTDDLLNINNHDKLAMEQFNIDQGNLTINQSEERNLINNYTIQSDIISNIDQSKLDIEPDCKISSTGKINLIQTNISASTAEDAPEIVSQDATKTEIDSLLIAEPEIVSQDATKTESDSLLIAEPEIVSQDATKTESDSLLIADINFSESLANNVALVAILSKDNLSHENSDKCNSEEMLNLNENNIQEESKTIIVDNFYQNPSNKTIMTEDSSSEPHAQNKNYDHTSESSLVKNSHPNVNSNLLLSREANAIITLDDNSAHSKLTNDEQKPLNANKLNESKNQHNVDIEIQKVGESNKKLTKKESQELDCGNILDQDVDMPSTNTIECNKEELLGNDSLEQMTCEKGMMQPWLKIFCLVILGAILFCFYLTPAYSENECDSTMVHGETETHTACALDGYVKLSKINYEV